MPMGPVFSSLRLISILWRTEFDITDWFIFYLIFNIIYNRLPFVPLCLIVIYTQGSFISCISPSLLVHKSLKRYGFFFRPALFSCAWYKVKIVGLLCKVCFLRDSCSKDFVLLQKGVQVVGISVQSSEYESCPLTHIHVSSFCPSTQPEKSLIQLIDIILKILWYRIINSMLSLVFVHFCRKSLVLMHQMNQVRMKIGERENAKRI